jgi:hypothetical protein
LPVGQKSRRTARWVSVRYQEVAILRAAVENVIFIDEKKHILGLAMGRQRDHFYYFK